jgi:hypothetical protein
MLWSAATILAFINGTAGFSLTRTSRLAPLLTRLMMGLAPVISASCGTRKQVPAALFDVGAWFAKVLPCRLH